MFGDDKRQITYATLDFNHPYMQSTASEVQFYDVQLKKKHNHYCCYFRKKKINKKIEMRVEN